MADIIAIGGGFGSANSFGGYAWGQIEHQKTQNYLLVVDNAYHGHTVDSVTITQQHTLTVSNALHGHTADNISIVQQHSLTVNSATHGLTSDTPWLIYNTTLDVSSTLHSNIADSVIITQQHMLSVANASHTFTIDGITITQQHTIVVDNTTHGITIDGGLILNQFLLMNKPDDAYHGLVLDNTILSGNQIIVVDSARHILYTDSPGLVNWSDLEKFFGIYKPGTGQYGDLTTAELAQLRALYSNLVVQKGSLTAVEAELGFHKKQYGKIGELLEVGLISGVLKPSGINGELLVQPSIDSGNIRQNTIHIGDLLSDKPLSVLSFEDGFALLSEDGLFHILEEVGNNDKIDRVSQYGILKQGNIEYGIL